MSHQNPFSHKHVVFLPPVSFDAREHLPANHNPDYRPNTPCGLVVGVPDPGKNIHPMLSFCQYIWNISPIDRPPPQNGSNAARSRAAHNVLHLRECYAILPGVTFVVPERETGWHRCQFTDDLNDGYYYLEHYLAMEERPELFAPVGSEDSDSQTAFVLTIQPAFTWQDHYRLSPVGYRAHGLYYSMGSGPGPVPALAGLHEQRAKPANTYQPDTPQHRIGLNFLAPEEPPAWRPDYRALARRAPAVLAAWRGWMRWFLERYHLAREGHLRLSSKDFLLIKSAHEGAMRHLLETAVGHLRQREVASLPPGLENSIYQRVFAEMQRPSMLHMSPGANQDHQVNGHHEGGIRASPDTQRTTSEEAVTDAPAAVINNSFSVATSRSCSIASTSGAVSTTATSPREPYLQSSQE